MKDQAADSEWEEIEALWSEHDQRIEKIASEQSAVRWKLSAGSYEPTAINDKPAADKGDRRGHKMIWHSMAAAMILGLLSAGVWVILRPATEETLLMTENHRALEDLCGEPATAIPTPSTISQSSVSREEAGMIRKSVAVSQQPAVPTYEELSAISRESVAVSLESSEKFNSDEAMASVEPVEPMVPTGEIPTTLLADEVQYVHFLAEEKPSQPAPHKIDKPKFSLAQSLALYFQRNCNGWRNLKEELLAETLILP